MKDIDKKRLNAYGIKTKRKIIKLRLRDIPKEK